MSIHVITNENRHLYEDQIEQQYRIRHDIYVKQRQWMALDRPDGREKDQFDDKHAIYLLALEGDEVVGGTRFVPTVYPHLMADVFPWLPDKKGLQRGYDIVEWTRVFVIPRKRGDGAGWSLKNEILAGMMEYCLAEGFSYIVVVTETFWLPAWVEIGWDVELLGGIHIVKDVHDMECVACKIAVNEETLIGMREVAKVPPNVLVWNEVKPGVIPNLLEQRLAE